jgi:hypothetical protein
MQLSKKELQYIKTALDEMASYTENQIEREHNISIEEQGVIYDQLSEKIDLHIKYFNKIGVTMLIIRFIEWALLFTIFKILN